MNSHFKYNKRQRNGIFFLIASIFLLQVSIYLLVNTSGSTGVVESESYLEFIKEYDSLVLIEKELKQPILNTFNPNYISDFKGYQLGLSIVEIDKLHEFRGQGKFVNSAKEFQEVTGVSDTLLKNIAVHFKFPDWVKSSNIRQQHKAAASNVVILKKDINIVAAHDLQIVSGIGEKIAARIINYRALLGGFSLDAQLGEVWGLKPDVCARLLERFEVKSVPIIEKLNVNSATFKELSAIAYIDYDLARDILNYKEEVAEIQSLEELKKIDGFPHNKFARIALYLVAE